MEQLQTTYTTWTSALREASTSHVGNARIYGVESNIKYKDSDNW